MRNWNDLRHLLAVQRGGTLAEAARRLGVDNTTVTRRLTALEQALGKTLIERGGDGKLSLTAEGKTIAVHAAEMERRAELISGMPDSTGDEVIGTVRVTIVPIIANRLLAPAAGRLFEQHPGIELELIAESRDLSLTRREADLALRMARPKTGGTSVKARRIADIDYACYAPKGAITEGLRWITYDEAMAHLPQARWIASASKGGRAMLSPLRVRDAETALAAVASGLGKTFLPRLIADKDKRLAAYAVPAAGHRRELWLLSHGNSTRQPHVGAVATWLNDTVQAAMDN